MFFVRRPLILGSFLPHCFGCRWPLLSRVGSLLALVATLGADDRLGSASEWQPVGLSGGGAMFAPAISPLDGNLMMLNCDMGGAYISENGGHAWRLVNQKELRSDTGCRPAFHPRDRSIIYASSAGRLRRSSDRGKTFVAVGDLRDALQGEIAINPQNPAVLLAGTRAGYCALSKDGGNSWKKCEGPQGRFIGFHFDATSQSLFAASQRGMWRSDDGGTAWTNISGSFDTILAFGGGSQSAPPKGVLYCSIPSRIEGGKLTGGILRSDDRGASWHPVAGRGLNKETSKADEWGAGPVAQYQQLLVADAQPLTVYALNTSTGFHPPHHETVYRSDDGGETWRAVYFQDPRFREYNVEPDYEVASTGQSFKGGGTPFGVAICSGDPDRVMLVMNECHVTENGGKTWFNGSTYPARGEARGPGTHWVCNGQVVTTTWHYYIDPHEANRHYIAYTDIGFARSTDAGTTWMWWDKKSWAPWRNTCYELAFDPEISGLMWGAFSNVHDIPNDNIISEHHGHDGPGGVCISTNFGAVWNPQTNGLPLKPVTSVVVDPRSPKNARTLYAGVFEDGVYKSVDSARHWTRASAGLGDPANMRVSRVFLHPDGTLFAMICAKRPARGKPLLPGGVGLYRSKDGAATWEKVNQSHLFLYPKDFSVHPADSRTILVGVCDAGGGDESGGLYRTRDGGATWERVGRKGPQTFGGYFHPKHPDWIYMTLTEGAPNAGLWFSQDDGQEWRAIDELPFTNVQRIEFDPADDKHIYATTFGASVWKGPAR